MPSLFLTSRVLAERRAAAPLPGREASASQDFMDALVPDAHLNAAVAGIRALGAAGLRVMAVGPGWTSAGLWSKHTAARALSPSIIDDPPGYAERIERLAEATGPLVIYPSREETIDAMIAERSAWTGAILPFPDASVLDQVRDKSRLVQTATAVGVDTPETLFCGPARELRSERFPAPVVVKPARPVSSLKTARLVRDARELETLLESVDGDDVLLVQERLHGPIVSVELVLDREGKVAARFQHQTRRTWPAAAGSIALATSVEPDETLVDRTASMLARVGYWGLAQVDFVDTPSGHVLLDVNPRFYRCLPLAIACGTNLPALWHAVTVGRWVGPPRRYRVGVTYRWLEADFAAAAHGAPRRLLFRTPQPHTGASWAAGDPLPGLLLSAETITSRALRMLGLRDRTR
jgi:glutathione synthase/RimK-type ligase-like ATP-grasp enzyme